MALNTSKCNRLMPLRFKGLKITRGVIPKTRMSYITGCWELPCNRDPHEYGLHASLECGSRLVRIMSVSAIYASVTVGCSGVNGQKPGEVAGRLIWQACRRLDCTGVCYWLMPLTGMLRYNVCWLCRCAERQPEACIIRCHTLVRMLQRINIVH